MTSNQRQHARYRIAADAAIRFRDQKVACKVLDVSASGAGLVLEAELDLPERFDLVARNGAAFPVHVAWRSGRRCGVIFDPAAQARMARNPRTITSPWRPGPNLAFVLTVGACAVLAIALVAYVLLSQPPG
jgi:hypothetical protein